MKHRGALGFRLGGGFFEFHLRALRRMSGTSAWFQDPLALGLCAPESRHDFELSAVQISGLPGYDRPHRDPASGKVIHSCSVASCDLLINE